MVSSVFHQRQQVSWQERSCHCDAYLGNIEITLLQHGVHRAALEDCSEVTVTEVDVVGYRGHMSPILFYSHWLPICFWVLVLTLKALYYLGLEYFKNCLFSYHPAWPLKLSSEALL